MHLYIHIYSTKQIIPQTLYRYHPMVLCQADSPIDCFRIRLVCELMETTARYLCSRSNRVGWGWW